jgi:hypothetical protein
MRISIHSRRFDFSTTDLRKITTKHKAKYKKGSDGLLPIKTTCAKVLNFSDYDHRRMGHGFRFVV